MAAPLAGASGGQSTPLPSVPSGIPSGTRCMMFLAFGTLGDILPLASLACAAAEGHPLVSVSFASHATHGVLLKQVFHGRAIYFTGIDSQPVVPLENQNVQASRESSDSGQVTFYG